MPLSGDIQTFSLSAIGRLLHQEKKTGILKVSNREDETSIFFRTGDIVFISSEPAAERSLGALLKEKQLVTDRDIEDSLEIARRDSRRLGVVLMENGLVSQEKLVQMLNYQFKEAISSVLNWREGVFVYEDGLKGFVQDIELKLDPIRLVAEAERWKAYRSLIPNDQVVFSIKEGALQNSSFSTDGSLRIMLLIDGQRDVSQIMTESGLPRQGVYRAISALAEQGAIERSGSSPASQTGCSRDPSRMVLFCLHTLHAAAQLMAIELGGKQAHRMVSRSLMRSFEDEHLAAAVVPGADPAENARRFMECQQKRSSPLDSRQLESLFKRAITFLLQEEYLVLGFKTVRETIGRLVASAETLKPSAPEVADCLLPFLHALAQDEGYFHGEKSPSDSGGMPGEQRGWNIQNSPKVNLEGVRGAVIIAFYSRLIHTVVQEMKVEIGSKAGALLSNIIETSDYYDQFMSQYRVGDDVATNINRMRDHISRGAYRLGKGSFVKGFQQALTELLLAKKQLLGEKSAEATVKTIETFLATATPEECRPLALNLMTNLKRMF